ncbi:MAG: metallophosphoesterase [Rikenellaceae bacterium]|nr:metallophosphoesterase [Rikenellaceae bacterium]MCL2692057.1 metallophosphoesterase [Rikenellaceae bacterium]
MKTAFSSLFAIFLTVAVVQAQDYRFEHGPYLQELTEDGVTVVFATSAKGFSWVEIVEADRVGHEEPRRVYDVRDGLRTAYNTLNAIRIEGLQAATRYAYRLQSKEMTQFQAYNIVFGDSIASRWHEFSTLDPLRAQISFIAVSDIHEDSEKLRTLLTHADIDSADKVFYIGDMMNHYSHEKTPWHGFLDESVRLFATERPFILVRGNHETRGPLARQYHELFPARSGNFYTMFRAGDVAFIVLDGGEDKPDTHEAYAGLGDFDAYRERQAEWLAEVVQSDEFRTARWRVVMSHFPPYSSRSNHWHGMSETNRLFMPILNEAGIDAMFAGHTHSFEILPPATGDRSETIEIVNRWGGQNEVLGTIGRTNTFPIVIGSNRSVTRVDADEHRMRIVVLDVDGNTLCETHLRVSSSLPDDN